MLQKLISTIAFLFGVVLFPAWVDARVITVGLDGNFEYANIQSAVDAAGPNDTILLADGIYTGPGNRGIAINKPLTIRGVGGPEQCIIDCEKVARGFAVNLDDPNAMMIFEGITLTNGSEVWNGGGIFFSGQGTAVLKHCIIRKNQAYGQSYGQSWALGGGICCFGKWDVRMGDCVVIGNQAFGADGVGGETCDSANGGPAMGGGFYADNGRFTLQHCTFVGNRCIGGNAGYSWRCDPPFPIAGEAPGAAIMTGGTVNISDSLIIGNTAVSSLK